MTTFVGVVRVNGLQGCGLAGVSNSADAEFRIRCEWFHFMDTCLGIVTKHAECYAACFVWRCHVTLLSVYTSRCRMTRESWPLATAISVGFKATFLQLNYVAVVVGVCNNYFIK